MKKIFLLILLSITAFTSGISAQTSSDHVYTLQECLRKTLDHSPRLKINVLENTKLNYAYRETVGQGLPSVNLSGSYDDFVNLPVQLIPGDFFGQPGQMIPVQFGTTYNLSGSLDFSQIIYNQTYLSALRVSKLMMDQNSLENENLKIGLVFETAQSYYYAQIASNQISNLRSNLEKLEKAEQIAKSQFNNGLIMKVDVDRIKVNRLNVQTQIDRLVVNYEQQLNFQRYLMGLDLDTPVSFPDSVSTATVSLLEKANPDNHIDIRMIEKQKQIALAGMRVNQSAWYPSLTLIGSFSYANQTNDFSIYGDPSSWYNTSLVGVRLSIPVFNGLKTKYKVSQSRISLDQLNLTEEDTRQILNVQARDANGRLLNAVTDEQRQRDNMTLAEKVYAISQEQYQKGVISLTDLLNAESGLRDAQTNHSLALVQMKIAELEYMKASGTLLDILK